MKKFLRAISFRKVMLFSIFLFFSFSAPGYALMEITLEWDPWDSNAQPDLAGYKFYFDTNPGHPYYELDFTNIQWSFDGGNTWYPIPDPPPINVGTGVTELSLRNLDDNKTYYFAVKAYDDQGRESDYSNEVSTFAITSPQDGFYVNASNYTYYAISGMGIAGASVDVFAGSTLLETTTVFSYGTWEITNINFTDFPSITEGSLSITAVSGSLTTLAVTGTFDITAPSSSANSLSYASGTVSLAWTADDATSGVASTELWYKKGSGGTWADTGLTAQAGTSGTFAYSPTQVEAGIYYFGTRSTDKAGNIEADPSGDGDISIEVSSGGDGGGGTDKAAGGGCFIATAVYGTPMSSKVKLLCQFRDKHLKSIALGRSFIALYERSSPCIANCISQNEYLKTAVRWSLWPVIGMAYAAVHTNLKQKMMIIVIMMVVIYIMMKIFKSFQKAVHHRASNL